MEIEYRNARQNKNGTIDIEWNHPSLGWIPFTADKDDVELHGRVIYQAIYDSGQFTPYQPEL